MSNPIVVWSEVPVTDIDKSVEFYNAVFGWEMSVDASGPNPMAIFGNAMNTVGGHLYPGKPGGEAGPTVHIAVQDKVEAAADRVRSAGGKVLSDPISIPPGRFVYAADPDGNSIGLFEVQG